MAEARAWRLVADARARAALGPLIAAHAATRPVQLRDHGAGALDDLAGVAAVLMVGGPGRAPRTALPGAMLWHGARPVPAGWLPAVEDAALAAFAATAARLRARPRGQAPVALLAQWDDAALRSARRGAAILGSDAARLWSADRIVRRDLLGALRLGPALAMYFGHGRAYGWAGYHGLHSRHLTHARGEPSAAVLSLTCRTATRHHGGHSFAERLVLDGVAGAAFGAVAPTRSVDNWRWGLTLTRRLGADDLDAADDSLGALLAGALGGAGTDWHGVRDYRIIGDPLTPLRAAAGAAIATANVAAPDPDDWRR